MEEANQRVDVAVVGGGIVGLATALALTEAGSAYHSVVVLEAEDHIAAHQTGHNSGVIHAGLYYAPGSLKARLCTTGRELMFAFCAAHGIAHERCGKLVVATRPAELAALDELERRGVANGLTAIRRLRSEEIRDVEPHAAGLAALHVGETGIVDYRVVAAAMARQLAERGATVRTGARLNDCRRTEGAIVLATTAGTVQARRLVACAGLQSDRVARLCGLDSGVRIVPFRGAYDELVPEKRHLVRGLIYPVPDPRFPFLGVHFTRTIHGSVEAGPNAVLALSRHGYRWSDLDPRDAASALGYRGTWHLARRYWRTAAAEMWRERRRPALVEALRRLVPELQADDLRPAGAGVRAQAVTPDGRLVDDFHIVQAPGMVHVLNAPSPAATAALAIGRHVAALVDGV
jgi:L-2-hydroxyglutarate oxidase